MRRIGRTMIEVGPSFLQIFGWHITGRSMIISGIPDSHLERIHWNYGGGRGAIGLRHLPSGIIVTRECLPNDSTLKLAKELVVELREKLLQARILVDEESPIS
jgi:hypothetical protein